MSNQLLPCPFCGGEPRLVPEDYEDKHGRPEPHAECDRCDLAIPLHTWNRRATQPAAGEPIGKVELFGINMTYVEWRDRKMPPLGTELYAAAPAAAHGDEAVRKDAERYRWVRRGSNGLALTMVANHSDAELDSEIDAAMRAQAGEGGEV